MNQSPYTPPKSSILALTENTPESLNPVLPDMSAYANSELREVLSNPDLYTPEAVHASARELAKRGSVPRYYTRVFSRQLGRNFSVTRKLKLDQTTILQHIFSETNLKKYCFLIAIFQSISSVLQVIGVARIFKTTPPDLLLKNWPFLFTSSFTVLSTLLLALFFFSLHQTLSSRAIHKI